MLQLPSTTTAPRSSTSVADPILKKIADHQQAADAFNDAYLRLDQAEYAQRDKHGHVPSGLIAWRYYSAIGEAGIEDARDCFLGEEDADPAQIEAEYIDAKKRYKATSRHITAWYKKTGLTSLRKECDDARRRSYKARELLSVTEPTTPAGASALLRHLVDEELTTECEWHKQAIETAIDALSKMQARR
jgi:hypothetical protein